MNYSKPEVKTLGEVKTVVERTGKQCPMATEPTRREFNPTYDLDEYGDGLTLLLLSS